MNLEIVKKIYLEKKIYYKHQNVKFIDLSAAYSQEKRFDN